MKSVIQDVFNIEPTEEYGCVENCFYVVECSKGKLHINSDFGIIEVVDNEGNRCEPGKVGRIITTGLINQVHPLIRYEVGDIGSLSKNQCDCELKNFPVLDNIVGRTEDVLIGADGQVSNRFHGIFIGMPEIIESQIIQNNLNSITCHIVSKSKLCDNQKKIVIKRFIERLGIGNINFVYVDQIVKEKNGKFKSVICNVKK